MKAYWQQFNEREQKAVLLAGVCLGFYLLYELVYAPLTSAVQYGNHQLSEKQTTLTWMQHVQQTYTDEKKPPQAVGEGNLLSILTKMLSHTTFHRFPYQLAQTATGEIQLSFEAVPYNAFMAWLQIQTAQYTMTIKNMEMSKTEVAGVVKISVVFGV